MKRSVLMLAWFMAGLWFLQIACRSSTPTSAPEPVASGDLLQTLEALPTASSHAPTLAPSATLPPGTEAAEETPATATPLPAPTDPALPTPLANTLVAPKGFVVYVTRAGDTLESLAGRFEVGLDELLYQQPYQAKAYLPAGLQLVFPELHMQMTRPDLLLPDGELVYTPSAVGFDVQRFVQEAGGFLSTYEEAIDGDRLSGGAIVQRVANEMSVNPRLLLAVLEQRSGWVYGQPRRAGQIDYPIGFQATGEVGLYDELRIAGTQLNLGYYGWKEGRYILLRCSDGKALRLNPFLNAGTTGVYNLYALLYPKGALEGALLGSTGLVEVYERMFGDGWARAATVEPLLPMNLAQPKLELPFAVGERWSFTSGPHWAWNYGTPRGALDFAPSGAAGCAVSAQWATASADGVVARAGDNIVALDLDGDGVEQTGWVLIYLHLADEGLVQRGKQVREGDPLGHPSCEGGKATGSHVHLARKYNGEWLPAEGVAPFVLSGYEARSNGASYLGVLVNGDVTITACSFGCEGALIQH